MVSLSSGLRAVVRSVPGGWGVTNTTWARSLLASLSPLSLDSYQFAHAIVEISRGRVQRGEQHNRYGLGAMNWTQEGLEESLDEEDRRQVQAARRRQQTAACAQRPKLTVETEIAYLYA